MKQITAYLLQKKGQLDHVPDPREIGLLVNTFFGVSQKIIVSVKNQTAVITAGAVLKNELLIHKEEVLRLICSRYPSVKSIRFI